ncbi:MAG: PAS domain S-box protein [Nitrospirae bacterium]|nr:PAS domain S-box protein [Nitrospirota bacterium]
MSVWDADHIVRVRRGARGRMTPGGLFFLLLGVGFALLIGMVSVQSNRIERLRATASEQFEARASAAARRAAAELSRRRDQATAAGLAERLAVRRITLWTRDGAVALDSIRTAGASASPTDELLPLTEQERRDLTSLGLFSPSHRMTSGGEARTYWLPLTDFEQPMGASDGLLLAVTLDLPPVLQEQNDAGVSRLLGLMVGALLVLLGYAVIRWLRALPRVEVIPKGGTAGSPIRRREAFVVGTFAGLIQELKEKEQELARLRSEAEERARHVESYNENILRSVASGVLTVDQELKITSYNEAAERILGWTRGQVIGRKPTELFGEGHPLTRIIAQTLERQEWLSRQELELDSPNGRVWAGMSTSLLRDESGAVLGATVVFTDLTEIKRLQEQVELRRRLAELGEVSAGIAHEFRNYMGTIMGYARLVAKSLKPDDPTAKMALAINEELKAMNRLIDDLLNFGRRTELSVSATDLPGLLARSIGQMADRSAEQHVTVTLDLPPAGGGSGVGGGGLPVVWVDEGLLYQALLNLFANALDAMPEGGALTVRARLVKPHDVEVIVSDTGVGIAPEHLDRIFLPMFTTKQKGTGLGLALAHKIILSHGGRIAVETTEGAGTTFRIVLPVGQAPAKVGTRR